MGLSCSFVVVEGRAAADVLAALGVAGSGELLVGDDVTTQHRSDGGAVDLGTGWALVADPTGTLEDDALAALSSTATVALLFVEEHVMSSGATCWQGGRERWSVLYEAGKGLSVTGSPPGYAQLEQAALAADPDLGDAVFEVPSQLVAQQTGWSWDAMDPRLWDEPVWLPLVKAPPPPVRRRWWSRR